MAESQTPSSPIPRTKSKHVRSGPRGPTGTAILGKKQEDLATPKTGRRILAASIVVAAIGGAIAAQQMGLFTPGDTVTVEPPLPAGPTPASVLLTGLEEAITVGSGVQAVASARDAQGASLAGVTITWESTDSSVATVSSDGFVRGTAPGQAQIIAHAGPASAAVSVMVAAPRADPPPRPPTPARVARVRVNPATLTLTVGQSSRVTATGVDGSGNGLPGRAIRWRSDDDDVASVRGDGTISAAGVGRARIVATIEGRTAAVDVTVSAVPVAAVAVAGPGRSLTVGESATLRATLRDASGSALTGRSLEWRSDAPAVASIDESGRVTARGAGTATVTATSEGRSGTTRVVVEAPAPDPDPTPVPRDPTPDITRVVTSYAAAIQSRNMNQVRALYPEIRADQAQGLQGLFDNARDLTVTMNVLGVQPQGERATARVEQTMTFRIAQSQTETSTFAVVLEQRDGRWVIVSVP